MHLFPNQMALVSTEKFRTDSNQCKEEKECRIPEPAKWRKRHLCSFSSTTVSITSSCKIFESIDYVKRHQHHLFQTHGFWKGHSSVAARDQRSSLFALPSGTAATFSYTPGHSITALGVCLQQHVLAGDWKHQCFQRAQRRGSRRNQPSHSQGWMAGGAGDSQEYTNLELGLLNSLTT